jgi:hypothetical protein
MSAFLPSCHNWPPILMFTACALATFVIARWARAEKTELPPWRWGMPPRRPKQDDDPFASNAIGLFIALFAVVYAIQNPPCG